MSKWLEIKERCNKRWLKGSNTNERGIVLNLFLRRYTSLITQDFTKEGRGKDTFVINISYVMLVDVIASWRNIYKKQLHIRIVVQERNNQ